MAGTPHTPSPAAWAPAQHMLSLWAAQAAHCPILQLVLVVPLPALAQHWSAPQQAHEPLQRVLKCFLSVIAQMLTPCSVSFDRDLVPM